MHNPFNSTEALANSCYISYRPGPRNNHVMVHEGLPVKWNLAVHVHEQVRALILNPAFPCILGRSAVTNNAYRFGFYQDATSDACIQGLCRDLWSFATEQLVSFPNQFSTFIASYQEPLVSDALAFETLLWSVLQKVNHMDAVHHAWDPTTSPDPGSSSFSFSFAGRSFFLVGLNPQSPRFSRKFPYPTLVFNSHDQFERLRAEGKFDTVQGTIRKRDMLLQGSLNPNLANYGDTSEAKQYSGRFVEKNWKCPFKAKQDDV